MNADLIAAGLSPFEPEAAAIQAGRIMLEKIEELAAARADFSFETTLSGKGYARMIKEWRQIGYFVRLVFLRLDKPETSIQRVATRVASGGHHVPDDVVRRRYHAGLVNFETIYKPIVSEWRYYGNVKQPRILLGRGSNED